MSRLTGRELDLITRDLDRTAGGSDETHDDHELDTNPALEPADPPVPAGIPGF